MTTYSVKKVKGDQWAVWQHQDGFKRQICYMSSDDILQLFNETVPREIEETFLVGNPDCRHAWRIWSFNNNFMQCNKCPAMKKIKRLVPREYKHG